MQTIHDTVEEIMAIPAVIDQMDQWGIAHIEMTTDEFNDFVATTIDVWRPLILSAKVNGG